MAMLLVDFSSKGSSNPYIKHENLSIISWHSVQFDLKLCSGDLKMLAGEYYFTTVNSVLNVDYRRHDVSQTSN